MGGTAESTGRPLNFIFRSRYDAAAAAKVAIVPKIMSSEPRIFAPVKNPMRLVRKQPIVTPQTLLNAKTGSKVSASLILTCTGP